MLVIAHLIEQSELQRLKLYRAIRVGILLLGILFTLFIFLNAIVPSNYTTLFHQLDNDNLVSGLVRQISPVIRDNYAVFVHGLFAFSYLTAMFVSISIFPGRSIVDVALLFFLFLIPRQRKQWGAVFDRNTNKPIPFALITIEKVADKKFTFLKQVISDFDGRYRATLAGLEGDIRITVRAANYKDYSRTISTARFLKEADLAVDIPMMAEASNKPHVRSYFNQFEFYNNNKIFFLIYIVSFVPLFVSIAICGFSPPFISIGLIVLYVVPILLNTFTLYKRLTPDISILKDELTHKPIQGGIIQLYDVNYQHLASTVTDYRGILNFMVPPGVYYISIFRKNYEVPASYLRHGNHLIKVAIDKRGYLSQNISLHRIANDNISIDNENVKLLNPFS